MGFTHEDMRGLLAMVGADPNLSDDDYRRSFEELELDSLARVEIASRVRDRFGLEVEQDLTGELSPYDVAELVNRRLGEDRLSEGAAR